MPVVADQRAGGSAAAEENASFVMGVLRRDGLVIPFASYNGRRWRASWPDDLRFLELPISLQAINRDWWGGVEPPTTMTLWSDGKAAADLTLVAPVHARLRCDIRMALRTNYHPAELPPPPIEQPFPKDGLVVSGPQRVEPIASVHGDAAEVTRVTAAILDEFNDEEQFAATTFTNWRHPVGRKERRAIPIEIEALYRAPMDDAGWTAYYVEAVRRYEPGPDDEGCGLLTSARGWLRTGPNGRNEVTLGAQVTYCDRYGVAFMLPLGLVRVANGTHWIYQLAGYEVESYLVARPTRRGIDRVIAYSAMSCPNF